MHDFTSGFGKVSFLEADVRRPGSDRDVACPKGVTQVNSKESIQERVAGVRGHCRRDAAISKLHMCLHRVVIWSLLLSPYRAARSRSTPAFLVHTSSRKVTSRLRKSRQRCHGPALKNWVSKGDPGGEWIGKITSSAPGSTGKRRWKAVCQPEPRGTVLVAGVGTRWGSPWPPRRRWGDFIPL